MKHEAKVENEYILEKMQNMIKCSNEHSNYSELKSAFIQHLSDDEI